MAWLTPGFLPCLMKAIDHSVMSTDWSRSNPYAGLASATAAQVGAPFLLFAGLLPIEPAFEPSLAERGPSGRNLLSRLPRPSAGPPNNALRPTRAPPVGRARLAWGQPNNKKEKIMPLYNFATYADAREEWAIEADSLDHAKQLIGDDSNGDWLDSALHLEAEATERRDEFATGNDETPAVEEITPDHWAWRVAHRDHIEHSLKQNIAAISGDFHTPASTANSTMRSES